MSAGDALYGIYRRNIRAGFKAIVGNNWATNAQQKILNKLHFIAYGKTKDKFDIWKRLTHAKYAAECDAKKAKIIDMIVHNSMSDTARAFLRWAKNIRDIKMILYGRGVKAGFMLYTLMSRFYRENRESLSRKAFRAIQHDPERIMRASFEKMVRAAGINLERSWLSWKMFVQDRNHKSTKLAKRNVAASNMGKVLDKKKRNHTMAGVKRLANGVAKTNAQYKICNRLAAIAFGQQRDAMLKWKE